MPEPYRRRQVLLRREDGTPAGFARMERLGARCLVEVCVEEPSCEARAVLLPRGTAEPRTLGVLQHGKTTCSLPAEDVTEGVQIAVLAGDRLLYAGGGEHRALRGRLTRSAPSRPTASPRLPGLRPSPAPDAPSPPDGLSALSDSPRPEEPPAPPWEAFPGADGWTLAVSRDSGAPNAPNQLTGRCFQHGRSAAVLRGVAGPYGPEPPPGLPGFTWDSGFWVRVERQGPAQAGPLPPFSLGDR